MDILVKRKTCKIFEPGKKHLFLHQDLYTCPIALPARQNPQHRSLLTVVLATSAPGRALFATFRTSLREFLGPVVNRFTLETLPIVHRKHFFINILCIDVIRKTLNRTLLFGSILKHGRHFDYWNRHLNLHMRLYYLDCQAGLCCYLVMHIETDYVYYNCFASITWPMYWLSLILGVSSQKIALFIAVFTRARYWTSLSLHLHPFSVRSNIILSSICV
jgi:hypothetical protein